MAPMQHPSIPESYECTVESLLGPRRMSGSGQMGSKGKVPPLNTSLLNTRHSKVDSEKYSHTARSASSYRPSSFDLHLDPHSENLLNNILVYSMDTIHEDNIASSPITSQATLNMNNGCSYLFGGLGIVGALSDLIEFRRSDKSWSHLATLGARPTPRWRHTLVECAGRLVMYGGEAPSLIPLPDLWVYSPVSRKWLPIRTTRGPLYAPSGHTAVVHNFDMYVYGGVPSLEDGGVMWKLGLRTGMWQKIIPSPGMKVPEQLVNHKAVIVDSLIYIYGGHKPSGDVSNELWTFNVLTYEWTLLQPSGTRPSARACHTMLKYGKLLVVQGGDRKDTSPYAYNIQSNSWYRMAPVESTLPHMNQNNSIDMEDSGGILYSPGLDTSMTKSRTANARFIIYPQTCLDYVRSLQNRILELEIQLRSGSPTEAPGTPRTSPSETPLTSVSSDR